MTVTTAHGDGLLERELAAIDLRGFMTEAVFGPQYEPELRRALWLIIVANACLTQGDKQVELIDSYIPPEYQDEAGEAATAEGGGKGQVQASLPGIGDGLSMAYRYAFDTVTPEEVRLGLGLGFGFGTVTPEEVQANALALALHSKRDRDRRCSSRGGGMTSIA